MVLHAAEPVRLSLCNDEDRPLAEQSLGEQREEIQRRREPALADDDSR
jgi:hypothetical protein